MIKPPCIEKQNRSTLWNNLPYCGMYIEGPFEGKYTNLPTPSLQQIEVQGSPLPLTNNGVNKELRLIGFKEQNLEAPVTTMQEWRLLTFSPWLEYRVKWSLNKKAIVGFYVPGYLTDINRQLSRRQNLLIGRDGPCIFEGNKGTFFFTYASEFCVIVEGDVSVKLNIKCRAPSEIVFPPLKLYKPVLYKLEDCTVYATETKTTEINRDISFIPTEDYIKLTEAIKKYLLDTSVLIDFTPTLRNRKLVTQTPSKTFNNLKVTAEGDSPNSFSVLFTEEDKDAGYTNVQYGNRPLELRFPSTTDNQETVMTVNMEITTGKEPPYGAELWIGTIIGGYFAQTNIISVLVKNSTFLISAPFDRSNQKFAILLVFFTVDIDEDLIWDANEILINSLTISYSNK